MPEPTDQKPRRRWKWRIVAVFLLIAAMVIAAKIVVRLIDFRPLIEKAVTKELGLRFDIGELEPVAIPQAFLEGRPVSLGEGDFEARGEWVEALGSLWRLAFKQVHIIRGRVHDMTVHLPATFEEAAGRYLATESYIENKKKPAPIASSATEPAEPSPLSKKDDGWEVWLDDVQAPRAQVFMGDKLALRADIEIRDLLTRFSKFAIHGDIPRFGEQASVAVNATIEDCDEGLWLTGDAILYGFSLHEIFLPASLPAAEADAVLEAEGRFASDLAFSVRGDLRVPEAPGLAGPFSGRAWLQDGRIIVNDFLLDGPGWRVTGGFTRETSGEMAFHVAELDAAGPGLTALMALASTQQGVLHAEGEGRLTVRDLFVGTDAQGVLRLVRGSANLTGADFLLPDGSPAFENLEGTVLVHENAFHLEHLTSTGLSVRGEICPVGDQGALFVDLAGELELNRGRLAAWLPLESIEQMSGSLAVERVAGTFTPGGGLPPDLAISAQLRDVSAAVLLPGRDAPFACELMNGAVSYEANTLLVRGLSGKGFKGEGSVRFAADGGFALDVRGEADLAGGLIGLVLPADTVRDLGGRAAFSKITGTFVPGQGVPADLAVEGSLRDARGRIRTSGYTDTLSGVSADFATGDNDVSVKLAALESALLGEVNGELAYGFAGHAMQGTLTFDLGRLPALFLPEGDSRRQLAALLGAFGGSTLELTVTLPAEQQPAWSIEFKREGAPPLEGSLQFKQGASGTELLSADVKAAVPLKPLVAAFLSGATGSGTAALRILKNPGESAFLVEARLDDGTLALGRLFRKRDGDPLSIAARGEVEAGSWRLDTLRIECLSEAITLAYQDGRLSGEVAADLGNLARLFPESSTVQGRIAGTIATAPIEARLALENAAFGFGATSALLSVSGSAEGRDGDWTFRDLHVQGEDTDCTLNATVHDDGWEADLHGPALNLDTTVNLINMLNAPSAAAESRPATKPQPAQAEGERAPATRASGPAGTLKIAIDSVHYHRTTASDFRAEATVTPAEVVCPALSFRPYSGNVSGSLRLLRSEAPSRLELDLSADAADLRIVDEVAYEETRFVAGLATGKIVLQMPWAGEVAALKGISGTLDLDLVNGSYGTMGGVTQALAFLRIFEFLRLSVPSLQRGLVYDHSVIGMKADQGVVSLNTFTIASKTYAMDGFGNINYRDETMDVTVRVKLLEVVTGIISHIPIVGTAVDGLASIADLAVRGTGSPFAPEFSVLPGVGTRKPQATPEEAAAPPKEETPPDKPAPKKDKPRFDRKPGRR